MGNSSTKKKLFQRTNSSMETFPVWVEFGWVIAGGWRQLESRTSSNKESCTFPQPNSFLMSAIVATRVFFGGRRTFIRWNSVSCRPPSRQTPYAISSSHSLSILIKPPESYNVSHWMVISLWGVQSSMRCDANNPNTFHRKLLIETRLNKRMLEFQTAPSRWLSNRLEETSCI